MITVIVVPHDTGKDIYLHDMEASNEPEAFAELIGQDHLSLAPFQRPDCLAVLRTHSMEMNTRATALTWVHNSLLRARSHFVCGDVAIVGLSEKGDITGAPEELIHLLFHAESFAIKVKIHGDCSVYGNQAVYDSWLNAYAAAATMADRWTQVEEVMVVPA